jgi:hypothetical protein
VTEVQYTVRFTPKKIYPSLGERGTVIILFTLKKIYPSLGERGILFTFYTKKTIFRLSVYFFTAPVCSLLYSVPLYSTDCVVLVTVNSVQRVCFM